MLCLFLTLSAWTFVRAVDEKRSFVPHFLCVAVIANLKAPMTVVPLAAGALFFASMPGARGALRRWIVGGLWLPLAFTWHLAQLAMLGGDGLDALNRILGQSAGKQARSGAGNWVFYGRTFLFGAFPWLLIYPFALYDAASGLRSDRDGSRRLLLAYLVTVAAFFMLVGKRHPWYVIPAYPFLSALVGIWLGRLPMQTRTGALIVVPALILAGLLWLEPGFFDPMRQRAVEMLSSDFAWRGSA